MLKTFTRLALIALAVGGLTVRGDDLPAVTGQYWFDNAGERHAFTPGSFEITTDGLPDGLHTLHAYVGDGVAVSSTHTRWFLKHVGLRQGDEIKASFYIDGHQFQDHELQVGANGIVNVDLDMSAVDLGVHTIGVSLSSPEGLPMGYRYGVFMRVPTELQTSTFSGYYYLDGKYIGKLDTQASDGVYHLDLDASSLSSGLHSVTAYLASPYGMASSPLTSWFIRIPEEGEGVKQYDYWVNDDVASLKTEVLPEVANPFGLISLIDVPEQPFRSASYTFAIEDQAPAFYASNDFTVRFTDPDGRVSTASRNYTDVRVRKEPEAISDIADGTRIPTGVIRENTIKLYQFDAETGDSIGVRLDRAAMLEVYDPQAGTLIKVSGADATDRRTFTARKTGRYYVAVHDVVNGNSANIDFSFVHKFALLEQSVGRSADRGAFETKVTGNGFESLESLVLVGGDAEYGIPQYRVADNNTLYALVDLDEHPMPLGEYRFKGVFKDREKGGEETILSSAVLTVEKETPVEIEVEIKPSFKIGTPYLACINVTNRSNVGCWGIPFNLAAKNAAEGDRIDFMDFAIMMDEEFMDDMPVYHDTDNLLNTGEGGSFAPTVIPFLGPGETKSFTIGLTTEPHELLTLYAWAGEPWSEEARSLMASEPEPQTFDEPFEGNLFTFTELCKLYRQLDSEGCLDYSEADLPELQGTSARAMAGGRGTRTVRISYRISKAGVYSCGNTVGRPGLPVIGRGMSLTSGQKNNMSWFKTSWMPFVHYLNTVEFANRMFALGAKKVRISFTKKGEQETAAARSNWKPSVPPQPTNPSPAVLEGFQSGDPNDISGYVSPSGSHYIGNAVKDLTYTIEFENDPEIASAAAARIKVNTTVDGRKLDLSSFRALRLTLGDKEIELPEGHHFVKTLDMRTGINAIAELTFDFDTASGEAEWKLRSLDPSTLEDVTYMGDGILPVNDGSGRGVGYLTYSIDLLPDLGDAETIDAQAVIVFDDNQPISTPVWTNETDYTLPTAKIVSQSSEDNQTFSFSVEGHDSGSGIWVYDLYMRPDGSSRWNAVKTQIAEDSFTYTASEVLNGAEFVVLATDQAGNRQDEAWLDVLVGDADGNGVVDVNDAVAVVSHYLGSGGKIRLVNADVTEDGKIDNQDAAAIINLYLLNSRDMTAKKLRIR